MRRPFVIFLYTYQDQLLLNPVGKGIDPVRKKFAWISTMATYLTWILVLTGFLLFGIEYRTLISYMVVLLAGFVILQFIQIILNTDVILLNFLVNIWLIDVAFAYVLKLGGIANSAGLAIAGLSAVNASFACQSRKRVAITIMLYILTIITAGIVHPWLTIPQEITPSINNRMFVLILVIVSVNGFFWVISFQNQRRRKTRFKETAEAFITMPLKEVEIQTEVDMKDPFLITINDLISRNIDDPNFGIDQLCRTMGMSRAQLYRNFRARSNRTLHDYIRFYRLNKAKELLLTTSLNVSEAAYGTGFTNPSHFSRIFTEEFGKHPKEFRKAHFLVH